MTVLDVLRRLLHVVLRNLHHLYCYRYCCCLSRLVSRSFFEDRVGVGVGVVVGIAKDSADYKLVEW
jgi:hypothetical protein